MNLRVSLKLVLAILLACNFNNTFAADKAKEVKLQPFVTNSVAKVDSRYVATGDYVTLEKVGYKQPIYKSPATVNGLGLKTARQLGIDGKKIYNEQEKSARVVILNPDALVFYDTGSLEPLYLAGCLRDGKPFANRLKLVETPVKKAVAVVPIIAVPEPTPVPVYVKPETVVVAKVQEQDIMVPVHSPRYEVTVHKQNVVYVPQQNAHPVEVWEQQRIVARAGVQQNRDDFCREPVQVPAPGPQICH